MKALYNPTQEAPVKTIFNGSEYELPCGETLVFEDDVANFLKDTYGFLEEVDSDGAEEQEEVEKPKIKLARRAKPRSVVKRPAVKTNDYGYAQDALDRGENGPNEDKNPPTDPEDRLSLDTINSEVASKKDKDGVEFYGPGVERDTIN